MSILWSVKGTNATAKGNNAFNNSSIEIENINKNLCKLEHLLNRIPVQNDYLNYFNSNK